MGLVFRNRAYEVLRQIEALGERWVAHAANPELRDNGSAGRRSRGLRPARLTSGSDHGRTEKEPRRRCRPVNPQVRTRPGAAANFRQCAISCREQMVG